MKPACKCRQWVPTRRVGEEQCVDCGDYFPCREKDCSHRDCIAVRAETRCHRCHRLIEGAKEACSKDYVKTSELPFLVVAIRGGHRAVHPACLDTIEHEERLTAERATRIAAGTPTLADIPAPAI